MKKLMPIIAVCLILAFRANAQVTVESMVDSNRILIGDVITYSVIVTHDPQVELDMPELAENLGQFELRDYEEREPLKTNGEVVKRVDYKISTFESGEFEIPPLQIGYKLPEDSVRYTLQTEPILITVDSLNPDDSGDIRGIKPPRVPPYNYARLIRNILLGVLVLLVIGGAVWIVFRRMRGEPILPARKEPPRPAHEIALERLFTLERSGYIENKQYKDYYTELSETLREYVGNRFFLHALEMTTLELMEHMKQENIKSDYVKQLHELLCICDLVKFASFVPPQNEHDQLLRSGISFVNETKIILGEPGTDSQAKALVPERDAAVSGEDENV